jgi:hypothetical protein
MRPGGWPCGLGRCGRSLPESNSLVRWLSRLCALLIMARLILLDSGPLGLMVRARGKPQVQRCLAWLNAVMTNAAIVVIPGIAHSPESTPRLGIRSGWHSAR